jgi:hypothetical protein
MSVVTEYIFPIPAQPVKATPNSIAIRIRKAADRRVPILKLFSMVTYSVGSKWQHREDDWGHPVDNGGCEWVGQETTNAMYRIAI